jgi:hypothetical protein
MTHSHARGFTFFILLSLAIASAAFAAKPIDAPMALNNMSVSASAIQWQASGTFERVVLTISGPDGFMMTKEFASGAPTLRLQDLGKMADGSYTWELRGVPRVSDEVKARLNAARAADDDAAIAKIRAEAGLDHESTLSGGFMVLNSSFVTNKAEEPPAAGGKKIVANGLQPGAPKAEDVVTADDEIIQGSLCVGLDCVVNESFGFDTIRLKENNTRIKFDDTSTSAGFPNNDWQLTANDSASGGQNKFSIEDITGAKVPFTITAGAPTNSLFVASSGKVGLGNSSPGLNIHITATDTPAIRQEQTNGGGFTAQTWDIGANEANWFVRDLTGGSRLPLRIRPGAPTSSVDISASGKVGIGTASPSQWLHAFQSADANSIVLSENSSNTANANAAFQSKSDTAVLSFQSHATARTISRFGVTLGGWNEMLSSAGNGLAIGTLGANSLILGTNSTNRLQIDGSTGAVTVSGNFTVTGVKNFAMPDPADANRAIFYASLEGPEAGTYFRGTAKTSNGEAVIEMPGYFSRITENERMTVQLTPVGAPGQIYVAEKTPQRIVIKAAQGAGDVEFDYFVQGVRKGYLDFQVERANNLPH